MTKAYIIGVGMTKFIKPRNTYGYEELGLEAAAKALLDAGITYDSVERVTAGYVYGDSTCGQRVVYQLGLTGVPVYNLNNNCSTGSTALALARDFVLGGSSDVVLALGFEKMNPGSLGSTFNDRTDPLEKFLLKTEDLNLKVSPACQFFANAGDEYIRKYGQQNKTDGADALARIAQVNHQHSVNNPYSQFQDVYTLEQIKASPKVHKQITKLQCCPTSDGAASAVVVSEKFLKAHPELLSQAVEIVAQEQRSDDLSVFKGSAIDLIGFEMTKRAVQKTLEKANLKPEDVQVVELHDCFSANELCVLDAMGLAPPGKAIDFVNEGNLTYGNSRNLVVNPSGGLISKGHPLGATGLAQAAELVWHLRGLATNRPVSNTKYCLQHNLGLGGLVVVTLYARADGKEAPVDGGSDLKNTINRFGYNPAVEAKHLGNHQLARVVSKTKSDPFAYEGNRLTGENQPSI